MKVCIALLLLAGSVIAAPAPQPADGPKFEAAQAELKQRSDRIKEEAATLGGSHSWAGNYFRGDEDGENVQVDLAPVAGFTFTWRRSEDLYGWNYGAVVEKGGAIQLKPVYAIEELSFGNIGSTLHVIRWGDRRYLVHPEDMKGFCDMVNAGSEPRSKKHGVSLLRSGDEGVKVTGFPEVPPEFRRFLLDQPITAKVFSVGKRSQRSITKNITQAYYNVTIDAGESQGVWPEMSMFLKGRGMIAHGRVVAVRPNEADLEIRVYTADTEPVAVGATYSTQLVDRARR